MSRKTKLKKLEVLIAAQELAEETVDSLYATLTEESSDQDLMVFGRHQMAVLVLDSQIRVLRYELGLKHTRPKIFNYKK